MEGIEHIMGSKEVFNREKWTKKYWRTLCRLHGSISLIKYERKILLKTIKYPSSLFRYRSVNKNSLDALQNNLMYFSSAYYYDDPFDTYLRVNFDKILKNIEKIKNNKIKKKFFELFFPVNWDMLKNDRVHKGINNEYVIQMRDIFQKILYSICFCENVENEVLWLKYADNHKGFVLEYSLNEKVINGMWQDKIHANLLPVYYSDERYNANLYAIFYLIFFSLDKHPELKRYYNILRDYFLTWEITKMSVIKKKCHEYDKEWRIVPILALQKRECIHMLPKSITIGLRTSEEDKQKIISAAQVAGISKFYQMVIDEHDNFVRKPLSV